MSCPQLTVETNGGFTIRSTVAVALLSIASVTVTVTVKLPVAVGVHVSVGTFADAHPAGRPAYAYVSAPVPPVAVTVSVTLNPRVIENEETENELIVGPLGTTANVIVCVTSYPLTVIVPEGGLAVYPVTASTEYGYAPFASENMIEEPVELLVVPARVTDQEVPEGRPVSVNVTEYVTCVNAIDRLTAAPFTVIVPEGGEAA